MLLTQRSPTTGRCTCWAAIRRDPSGPLEALGHPAPEPHYPVGHFAALQLEHLRDLFFELHLRVPRVRVRSTWDEDASPVALNQLDNRLDNRQFTQEFRLNGTPRRSTTRWALSTSTRKATTKPGVTLNYALIDFIHGPDPTPADTQAAFAHADWHITDDLNLIRWRAVFRRVQGLHASPAQPGWLGRWQLRARRPGPASNLINMASRPGSNGL